MAKASSAFADAIETSVGIQEGNVEVVGAVCRIHQFPPSGKSGNQSAPFTCSALQLQKLDKDMDPTEDEPEWVYYSYGKDSTEKFHPGSADSADDDDPTDEGDDVETEGNTIFLVDEGTKLNRKCKWILFCKALEAKGFKASILAKSFLPDLIGMKGHVITQQMDKIEGNEKAPTVLLFDRIDVFPYGKSKSDKSDKSDKSSKSKSSKKDADEEDDKPAKSSSKSKKDEDADEDVDEGDKAARKVLKSLASKLSEQTMPIKKLLGFAQTNMIQTKVSGTLQKDVKAKLGDEDWLTEVGKDELEILKDVENDEITFAEA